MAKVRIFQIIVVFIVLTGCSDSNDDALPLTEELNATYFTVDVPAGWVLTFDQGIDTIIGRISNNEDTIYFDYGYLSFGGLERVERNNETISFIETQINGIPSIIVKENTPYELNNNLRISAYIDKGDQNDLNRLYSFDPIDEATVLAIMRSHKFTPKIVN